MAIDKAPVMAVQTRGSGPDLVLFHGGMGCWQHWVRNIEALSEHFTVHALDHPSYGASLHALAGVLSQQGKYGDAEALLRESLAIDQKVLDEHDIIRVQDDYGRK